MIRRKKNNDATNSYRRVDVATFAMASLFAVVMLGVDSGSSFPSMFFLGTDAFLMDSSSKTGFSKSFAARTFRSSLYVTNNNIDGDNGINTDGTGTVSHDDDYHHHQTDLLHRRISRRGWLSQTMATTILVPAATGSSLIFGGKAAIAVDDTTASRTTTTTTTLGEITDKVYVDVSGLSATPSAEIGSTRRIVLGLFGRDAPQSTQKLKRLFGNQQGLEAPCKPLKQDFLIQREQLEANKIYRSCLEGQDRGVTYDYAQIWRIVRDERIDFGSVAGKFNAREYPTWAENKPLRASEYLKTPSTKYLVGVRKGSDSGFGYTLFPKATAGSNEDFLENYLVVGTVFEGEDVVDQINEVSVVSSSKRLNYMSIVGAANGGVSNAPKKDCRYGGPMYCNENKPLTKLTMFRTGIL